MKFVCRETIVETREFHIPDHLYYKMDDDEIDNALETMRCEDLSEPDQEVVDVAWETRG